MPSLLDTIDKLTYTANSLHLAAVSSDLENMGPFAQAMLYSSPQDIIREADETEYDLFHFVTHENDPSTSGPGKLERKEYKAATPLRARRAAGKAKNEEPEVYLEAALRYLDKFHSIKPMAGTRAHLESLVNRLDNVRNQIDELQQFMQEEKAINELKVQISQSKKRKDALRGAIGSTVKQAIQPALKPSAGLYSRHPRPQLSPPITTQSTQINLQSFPPSSMHSPVSPVTILTVDDHHEDEPITIAVSKLDDVLLSQSQNEPFSIAMPSGTQSQIPNFLSQVPSVSSQKERISDSPFRMSGAGEIHITPEMERICEKIWATIPDLLVPTNYFAHAENFPTAKDTMTILEAILSQTVLENSTINSKISPSSTRSAFSPILGIEIHPPPTAPHQTLTALMLVTLLTSPNYSIPLNALKARLASKAVSNSGSQAEMAKHATASTIRTTDYGSRAIYVCVAKKLIKIDRGGGEQIVKFEY